MVWSLCLSVLVPGLSSISLGHPLVDDYVVLAGARLRRNSWLALGFEWCISN
jgi:hypothetical protein